MVQRGESIDVSPAVLVWARRSVGLESGEAADVAGVTVDDLRGWESGATKPALADLVALARAYQRPLAALLLSEPPRDEGGVVDFRRHRGYQPPRMSPGVHLGLRHARRQQQIASELSAALNIRTLTAPQAGNLPDAETMAVRARRELAVTVAQQAGWTDEYAALRAWRRAVEDLGAVVLQVSLPADEVRGFSFAGPGMPTIALAASDAVAARIFTLLHELGHLLLGEGGICSPEAILRSGAGSVEVERYCNRFAGNVLVPSDALRRHPTAQRIAAMEALPDSRDFSGLRTAFRVSDQVLWYRLHEIGLVADGRYEEQWQLWSGRVAGTPLTRGGGRHRAKRSLDMNGPRFVGLVLEAEEQGEITYSDALDYLSIWAGDWNELTTLVGGVG